MRGSARCMVVGLGLSLGGCGGGGEQPGPLPSGELKGPSPQAGQEPGRYARSGGPDGVSKPGPEPVIRRLGPGEPCVGVFGVCDAGLSCVDGVCCTSKCDEQCERCDLELQSSGLDDEPRYTGNCTLIDSCSECVRYVDGQVPSSGDGLSWARALQTVQEGIDAAHQAVEDAPELDHCEVWVVQGTYYIYVGSSEDTVQLQSGVALYGGFAGGEILRAQRSWTSYVTVLDGRDEPGGTNRVHHVVTGSDDAVLDGFTVTGGSAAGNDPHHHGGGMYNYLSDPTLRNCTFTQNAADDSGGGMYNIYSHPTIERCTFVDNTAEHGGGMYNEYSSPALTDCAFIDNTAPWTSGGMGNYISSPTVTSCTFVGNHTDTSGGAIMNVYWSSPIITSSTFYGNSANNFGGGLWNTYESDPTVTNCILWGNSGGQIVSTYDCSPTVTYSDVQHDYPGVGNIHLNPLLVDPGEGDLHLGEGSPCIDAANGPAAPALDIDGNPRVDDPDSPNTGVGPPWADMGAYEHQL